MKKGSIKLWWKNFEKKKKRKFRKFPILCTEIMNSVFTMTTIHIHIYLILCSRWQMLYYLYLWCLIVINCMKRLPSNPSVLSASRLLHYRNLYLCSNNNTEKQRRPGNERILHIISSQNSITIWHYDGYTVCLLFSVML
jgi:hypothetical protein